MEVKWIKLCVDLFQNPKLVMLRSEKNGDRLLLIWIMLLTLAGRCNRGGRLMLTDDIPYNTKMLSRELGFSEKLLELAFEQFVRLNMIKCGDGVYSIRNWEKYQNVEGMDRIRESKRLAQARWRAKKISTVDSTVDSTRYLVDDAEEDEEAEKETEKEFHSFSRAGESVFDNKQKRSYLRGSLGQGVVLLSDEQFDDLLDRLSLEEFEKYVGIVRDNELAGKHYRKKTHYQAILDMAMQDRRLCGLSKAPAPTNRTGVSSGFAGEHCSPLH